MKLTEYAALQKEEPPSLPPISYASPIPILLGPACPAAARKGRSLQVNCNWCQKSTDHLGWCDSCARWVIGAPFGVRLYKGDAGLGAVEEG